MAENKKESQAQPKTEEIDINSFFDVVPEQEPIIVSIVGDGGMGKTHFANTFPNPVINDSEGRAKIVAKKFPKNKDFIKHTPDIQTIRETISLMIQNLCPNINERHNWTWVMDSGSDWLQFAETEYLKEAKKEKIYPTVLWAQVYNKIDQIFSVIRKQGFNAVITQQLKEEYKGDKATGNFIPSGYKKFPYRVDVSIYIKKGIEYDGNIYYENHVVGEVLKDCWHHSEEKKPYILDISYDGIFNELKPYKHPGSYDKAIKMVLEEMAKKTGIPVEKAKSKK